MTGRKLYHGLNSFNRKYTEQINDGRQGIALAQNVVFAMVEAFYSWQAGSLALLADAAHNLSDVGGLLLDCVC